MSEGGAPSGGRDRNLILVAVAIVAALVLGVIAAAIMLFLVPTSTECTSVTSEAHAPGEEPTAFVTEPC